MMTVWTYWVVGCGLLVQVWLFWQLGELMGALIKSALVATSITRFCWVCGRTHGFAKRKWPVWMYAPLVWWGYFILELTGCDLTGRHMGGTGEWRGIGDWTVRPRDGGQA